MICSVRISRSSLYFSRHLAVQHLDWKNKFLVISSNLPIFLPVQMISIVTVFRSKKTTAKDLSISVNVLVLEGNNKCLAINQKVVPQISSLDSSR